MQPAQELFFGWMGLSPALLLDPPPSADNLLVRVVRPGEAAEAVVEEARAQLAAAGGRRRRRGRGAGEASVDAPAPARVEITPLPDSALDGPLLTVSVPSSPEPEPFGIPAEPPVAEPEPTEASTDEPTEDAAEPRRRRRRSSAAG
jgi:ribonuclease E